MGATDEELARWIGEHSKIADPAAVLKWNNRMRDMRIGDMSLHAGTIFRGVHSQIRAEPSSGVRLVRRV